MSYADITDTDFDEVLHAFTPTPSDAKRLVQEIYFSSLRVFHDVKPFIRLEDAADSDETMFRVLSEIQIFFLHLATFAAPGRMSKMEFAKLHFDAAIMLSHLSIVTTQTFAPQSSDRFRQIFLTSYDVADDAYERANPTSMNCSKANLLLVAAAVERIAMQCGCGANMLALTKIQDTVMDTTPTLDLYGALEKPTSAGAG